MHLKSRLLVCLSRLHKWINSTETYHNYRWYVFIALVASIIQILTYCNVRDTSIEVKNLAKSAYNAQDSDITKSLDSVSFIKLYFNALATQDYSLACGLESRRRCLKDVPSEFIQYAEDKKRVWFTKWEDGEHILDVWIPKDQPSNAAIETVCVKTSYASKGEKNTVTQIARYDLLKRPTGEKEIAGVLCEKTIKNGIDRTVAMGCGQSSVCNPN